MSSSTFPLRLATEQAVVLTVEQIAREGARRFLQKAIEDEVADYINVNARHLDEAGRHWWFATATSRHARFCRVSDRSK